MNFRYLFILFFPILACTSGNRPESAGPPKPSTLSGQELAAIHCASCHLFPAPDLLSKAAWKNGVLPEMAYRLGMRPLTEKMATMDIEDLQAALQPGVYPDGPVLAAEDWQKIIDYYLTNAPAQPLPQDAKATVKVGLPYFEVKSLGQPGARHPMVSMVKIDPVNGQLFVSRRETNQLEIYDASLHKKDSVRIESPLSDLAWLDAQNYLTLEMGIMDPNDSRKGKLKQINAQKQSSLLVDSLRRPVQLTIHDLNQDSVPDYLICNYGNERGLLAWYDGKTRQEHGLSVTPGARITRVMDLNKDGLPDIVVLMCQAWERISVFYNYGKGHFEEEVVLKFPPVYGSSSMDVADMNGDGYPDIIYTNGDNADYSAISKRYHGLRIFLNDGKNHFAEQYFYPIHGAGQVRAADFDGDGDLDLAATAFFTEPKQSPNEGFLFFQNQGNLQFDISTFASANQGKWLVMDVGDLDRDGRPDIVLGNFMKEGLGQNPAYAIRNPLSIVWLRNTNSMHK